MSDIEDYSSYSSSDESEEDIKPNKKGINIKPNIDVYNGDENDDNSDINDDDTSSIEDEKEVKNIKDGGVNNHYLKV